MMDVGLPTVGLSVVSIPETRLRDIYSVGKSGAGRPSTPPYVPPVAVSQNLLLQDGTDLLLQDGTEILLEA